MHWIDKLADGLIEWWGNELKEPIILNGGLSVSGLQHVGRLRGEITLNSALKRVLEERGYRVEQYLTLYTQDEWKGKKPQLEVFRNREEAKKYIGWRLIDVPDPFECHNNWVEHYWEDFGGFLDKFAEGVKVITTTELYKGKLKPYVVKSIELRSEIRDIINKYRGRKPLPENWYPFQVVCESCKKIGRSEILEIDLEKYRVKYKCNNCGYEGETSLENGKLNWRVEWAAIWSALDVSFEPYGKDHATPGGSRDSASELSTKIFNRKKPFGAPYEWVAEILVDGSRRVMGSSDFSGFTPKQWYEVAEPEVIRFIYLVNEPMKQIYLGLHLIPQYYNQFDEAEEIYFSERVGGDIEIIKRSYELAMLEKVPEEKPRRIPYSHLALLVQSLPGHNLVQEALNRLESTLLRGETLSDYEVELLKRRLFRAKRWVENYAPENMRFKVISEEEVRNMLPKIKEFLSGKEQHLIDLLKAFERIPWVANEIKEAMKNITSKIGDKKEITKFFKALYLTFLGKDYGPRMAPMLSTFDKDFVLGRLEFVLDNLA